LAVDAMLLSSAYMSISLSILRGRALINKMKNKGPNMDPCFSFYLLMTYP
jgi:hypothetical protein